MEACKTQHPCHVHGESFQWATSKRNRVHSISDLSQRGRKAFIVRTPHRKAIHTAMYVRGKYLDSGKKFLLQVGWDVSHGKSAQELREWDRKMEWVCAWEARRVEGIWEKHKKRKKQEDRGLLRMSRDSGAWDHLSCSCCASCSGWGDAGVRRAPLLWRNLTRPRKSSAAYSSQRSGLIASLAFPVTKSHPSEARWGGRRPRRRATLSLPLPPPLRNYSDCRALTQKLHTLSVSAGQQLSRESCFSLVQTSTQCLEEDGSRFWFFYLPMSLRFCLLSPAKCPGREKNVKLSCWESCVLWAPRTGRNASRGGSELHLHVNQQLRGSQVTEIEQWPALAKNRSGEAQGLEQHWCV